MPPPGGTGRVRRAPGGPAPRDRPPPSSEVVITAIIAAVLFGIALLMHLANFSLGQLDATFFMLAGLVATALHLAGIGATTRRRVRN